MTSQLKGNCEKHHSLPEFFYSNELIQYKLWMKEKFTMENSLSLSLVSGKNFFIIFASLNSILISINIHVLMLWIFIFYSLADIAGNVFHIINGKTKRTKQSQTYDMEFMEIILFMNFKRFLVCVCSLCWSVYDSTNHKYFMSLEWKKKNSKTIFPFLRFFFHFPSHEFSTNL